MLGLSLEKLFLVAVVAGVVIGPARLPGYAHRLAELVRAVRRAVETGRAQAEAEMGVTMTRAEWEALDLRRYDPRRVVRDALVEPPATATGTTAGPTAPASYDDAVLAEAARVRPGQRYLVSGPASHPRRVLLASLAADDPRRLAAEVEPLEHAETG